ncbi:MAG: hypothetical protein ACX94C_02235 [Phycisphaerales bacterium]
MRTMAPAPPNNPKPRPHRLALAGIVCGNALILSGIAGTLAVTAGNSAHPHATLAPVSWSISQTQQDQPSDDQNPDSGADEQDETDQGIRECVITLSSGRTITGELVRENTREVVIGINGIETTFQRRNVAHVVILPPVAERYERLRASVDDSDIDSRLALVEWLRARRAYRLAIKELESILIVEPNNPRAKLLHTWLKEYDKLAEQDKDADSDDPKSSDSGSKEPGKKQRDPANTGEQGEEAKYKIERNALPLLTDEQINLMKVYEIDLRNPPEMRISDDTMLKLMREFPDRFSPNEDERAKILHLPPVEKLKLIFSLRARDLYGEIEVLESPTSLEKFKQNVHSGRGWLMNACATTRCHGGVDAGSFRLINEKPNTDETAFTNLYILENTTLSNGLPLIDFENPDRSPLLQMGMIPSKALIPHPEIPRDFPGMGYRSIFRSTRDRKYQQAVEWIRSMYQPRPELEFDYPPAADETQPETDQTQP